MAPGLPSPKAPSLRPVFWLPGRHLQTIVPSLWPTPRVNGRVEHRIVAVAEGSAVRLQINRPGEPRRGTLLLIHGMGGSAESAYMRRTAAVALARGWVAVRMNLRTCGGTEALSAKLYNAGQSSDVGKVLADLEQARFPEPFAVAGFSLGGNIALRYAGVEGSASRAAAVAAVNPPVDLEQCADSLEQPRNRLYQRHYARALYQGLKRFRSVRNITEPVPRPGEVRTVRRFDDRITAPDAGYACSADYYADASAGPRMGKIRVPTLVVSASNDPFVPVSMFDPHRSAANVRIVHPKAGGHCGYWHAGRPRFWAAAAILEAIER